MADNKKTSGGSSGGSTSVSPKIVSSNSSSSSSSVSGKHVSSSKSTGGTGSVKTGGTGSGSGKVSKQNSSMGLGGVGLKPGKTGSQKQSGKTGRSSGKTGRSDKTNRFSSYLDEENESGSERKRPSARERLESFFSGEDRNKKEEGPDWSRRLDREQEQTKPAEPGQPGMALRPNDRSRPNEEQAAGEQPRKYGGHRNFLAETMEQKKPEQKTAEPAKDTAKNTAGESAEQLYKQADALEREKQLLIASGEGTAKTAGYDARINDLRRQADEKSRQEGNAAPQPTAESKPQTNAERDALLKEYQKAVENERTISGYAYDDPSYEAAREATLKRQELEDQLKDMNRQLGLGVYEGLADEAQARDMFGGWAGDRAAGGMAAVGTGSSFLGNALGTLMVEDPETGELSRWEENPFVETGEALTGFGDTLFEGAKEIKGQAEKDWGDATEDMSKAGKFAANLGKTAADMTLDMVENFILPGSGRVAMGMRAAGFGALTQDERGNNDINSRAAKAALDGAAAYLSEYLVGGAEAVYGKSILGKAMEGVMKEAAPGVQFLAKTVFNTEGVEEGMEYAMSYLGDRILNLDPEEQWSWDEFKQNVAMGYVMGVLFNGVAGGISYDGKHIQNVVDEAIDAANSGLTPEEIVQTAMMQPNEDVKIEAGKQRADPLVPEYDEGRVDSAVESAQPEQRTPEQQDVIDILMNPTGENGRLSNKQVQTITGDPALLQAFQEVTGTTPDTSTASNTRNSMKDAAAQFIAQEAQNAPVENPDARNTNILADTAESDIRGLTEPEAKAEPAAIPENTKATELKRGDGKVSYDGADVDGVHYDAVDLKNLTYTQRAQISAMESVAKATGVNVVFFQSHVNEQGQYEGANGFYKDGTVYLDVNAGLESRMEDGSTVGETAIVRTASHELTHFIQDFSESDYNGLRDYITDQLVQKTGAEGLEELIQQKMDRDASGQLTREEALDEVIADGCEMMLKDSEAVERLANENPTLATRIRDWIREWVGKIRAAFEGVDATHREARILMEDAEKLQKMWDDALVKASKNNTGFGNTEGETKYSYSDIREEADALEDEYPDVVPDAQNATEEAFVTEEGKTKQTPAAKYSLRSMRHDVEEGKMFEDLAAHTNMSSTEIENLRNGLNHLMDVISLNRNILDMNETYGKEDRPFKPFKPNSDPLYTISLDFSTLCRKRLMTQYVIEKLQTTLTDSETGKLGRALSAEEQLAVRDLMKEYAQQDKALKVACAMCYVEAARLKAPKQITKFIRDPESAMLRYFALKNKEFNASVKQAQADFKEQHGYDRNAAKKDMKPADVRALNKLSDRLRNSYGDQNSPASAEELEQIRIAKTLPNETYLTAANLAKLAEEHPVIYDAYTATIRTATRSKSLEADIPYYYGDSRGEVSDEFIKNVNAENGMRFSSWSDFQIQHMLDMMTAVIELGSRNTAMHGYTKFLEQVRIFGKTGMMFNMSGVPQGTGLKADGSLDFSPTESVLVKSEDGSEYDAIRARDEFPETAGLQCIGISPEHIKALLDSDIIDYIIPYHTSGLNASLRRMAQISNWDDFTTFQNAAEDKSIRFDPKIHDKDTWHKEPVFSEFFNAAKDPANGYQEGEQGVVTMRRAADLYKQMCAERGLKPKFSWSNSKVDADFSNDPNYWKLLIDRKMINQKTGQLIEQKPVRPDFDFDLIENMVQEAVDSYDPTLQDRALDYVRGHFDELPKRISDLKKSGAVKKAVAGSRKADKLAKSFNELQAGVVAAAGQTAKMQLRENGTGRIPPRQNPNTQTQTETRTEPAPAPKPQDSYDSQNPFNVGEPAAENGRERISQFYSNTLLKREDAGENEPITYRTKKDIDTLNNAVKRLGTDFEREMAGLLTAGAWTDEQVHMGRAIGKQLLADGRKTGDMTAYRMWRDTESAKIRETARGLRAVALEGNPGAESVLRETEHIFSDLRNDKNTKASEEDIKQAEKETDRVVNEMLDLEDREEQAKTADKPMNALAVKEGYLDLADRLNAMRNTGRMRDAGKNRQILNGERNVQTAFRKMLEKQDLDYIKRYVACQATGLAEDLNYKGKQDRLRQVNTFQKLAQLTGTGTWGRNLEGNAAFGIVDTLAANNPVTLIADAILGKATGKRSQGFERGVLSGEARRSARQNLERSILEVAGNIDLAEGDQTKYDTSRTRTFDPAGSAFSRVLSRWEQMNGYALNSSDAWFKGMTEGSFREAAIRANGWDANNLTPEQRAELDEAAQMVAEYRTFQNQGKAAQAANGLRDGLNRLFNKNWEPGQFGVGTALVPYTTVPANIGVKALEFSPAGAVKGLAEMIKVGMDAKNGKATMARQNQAVTDFGRGVTGTALIVGLAALMKNAPWFRDWEEEEDKNVKAQNKAEGKSGMQLNVDMFLAHVLDGDDDPTWLNSDHTIDISSIEPLNQIITAASLLADDKEFSEAVLKSAKDSFMDIPAVQQLKNIEDNIRYTETPDDLRQTLKNTAAGTAGGIIGGFIPAPLRHASAAADQYQRDTSGANAAERAWNQIVSATPWRQSLPVKTDAYGNPIEQGDIGTRLATQYLPSKYSQVNQSEVSREVERIRNETGIDLTPDRTGPKKQSFGKGSGKQNVELDTDDSRAWKNANGKAFEELMDAAMDSPVYRNASADDQAELGSLMKEVAKDEVKGDFAEYYGLPYESSYDEVRDLDDPVSYLLVNKEFGLSEKEGNWDAVDALLPEVKSMSKSDRDYLREKNKTLGSYYDFLTPNARGLSASSAEAVHDYKEGISARAEERGVSSASSIDRVNEIQDGLRSGKYSVQDADAFMTKQQSDGDYDASKGKAAIYLAIRAATIEAGGKKAWTAKAAANALQVAMNADKNDNGIIEYGFTQKHEKEVSRALSGLGFEGAANDALWDAYSEFYYSKRKK